jgi:3-oxoacyl-[acyl-carrier-protein] synthase II
VHGTSVGGSRALMKAQYQYDTAGPAAVGGTEGGLPAASGQADGDFVRAMYIGQASDGMTTAERDPARASLPFDVHRSGIVTGEGSAALVLESSTGSGTCRCRSARSRATSDTPAPPRVR